MKVPASERSAFINEIEDGKVTIEVHQPSDCLALLRNYVRCDEVHIIHVWIGYKLTSQINGPTESESPEVWQTAVHHLLNTYKPHYCHIYCNGAETGLEEDIEVQDEAQGCYRGFWDDKQHTLSIIRLVCQILNITIGYLEAWTQILLDLTIVMLLSYC